jgi:steroid delta-isomerase-like uncharacterized protein
MSVETTRKTLTAYLDKLVQRAPYAQYFADDVTFTVMGTDQEVKGRAAVEQFIRYFHEQAFDARPELKRTITGDDAAAIEADFIGTHTGDFLGVPATGKQVNVPYAVHYEFEGDEITALRCYISMDVLLQQIGTAATAAHAGTP